MFRTSLSRLAAGLSLGAMLAFGFSSIAAAEIAVNASAAVTVPADPAVFVAPAPAEPTPQSLNKVSRLSFLIKRGDQLIDARLSSLAKLKTRVASSSLTAEQKASLVAIIDSQSAALAALEAQINADTSTSTARDQVKSIYSDFRVYAVLIPKLKLMMALDSQANHLAKLGDIFAKAQTKIDTLKAEGKNVESRQSALDSAKAVSAGIETKISASLSALTNLKASDYPVTSRSVLGAARAVIRAIHRDFVKIRASIRASIR